MVKYKNIHTHKKKYSLQLILFTQCLQTLVYFIPILHILHNGARLIYRYNTSVQIYTCVSKISFGKRERREINRVILKLQ